MSSLIVAFGGGAGAGPGHQTAGGEQELFSCLPFQVKRNFSLVQFCHHFFQYYSSVFLMTSYRHLSFSGFQISVFYSNFFLVCSPLVANNFFKF